MAEDERWSWHKFFKGFLAARNFGKAIVMMFCSGIIILVCFSTYTVVKSRFVKVRATQEVGSNSGTIVTENTDKQGNTWSLFNLFNWR